MTSTVLPKINAAPKYLTSLWRDVFGENLIKAKSLPGVLTNPEYTKQYNTLYNIGAKNNKHYLTAGKTFSWDYTFAFDWDPNIKFSWKAKDTNKRDETQFIKRDGSCPLLSSQTFSKTSTDTSSKGTLTSSAKATKSTAKSASTSPKNTAPITPTVPLATIASKTTTTAPKFTNSCYPFADPDAGPAPPLCQCDGMDGFYLAMTGSAQVLLSGGVYGGCQYTAPPTPSPTAHPAFTETRSDGLILSCASSTYFNFAVDESAMCAGSSKVISTITSIYSAYTASAASAQSVAEASSRSAASAAAASASATAAAPHPYRTGTCDLHITEASYSYYEPLYVQLNITDGADNLLASQNFQIKWGGSVSISASESHLPYDVTVDFLEQQKPSNKLKKRVDIGPATPPVNWEAWVLSITAGNTKWNDSDTNTSNLPYCDVGGWDNGNFWDFLGVEADTPVS
jgi:hypothetical protein